MIWLIPFAVGALAGFLRSVMAVVLAAVVIAACAIVLRLAFGASLQDLLLVILSFNAGILAGVLAARLLYRG
ncbi:hypothetical protein PRN20_06880 [Devosia sp. ZB163]|uniref:hypothetical protein n=1 Tax=Devosia sp. ZB163 TaxID=3025938 RepID=UPI00236182BC|nr:hypothetical protein [Devosia sp. ZB163]MDC9823452.1 hypothetical protein [Devosia sp. ZB163]